MNVRCAGQTQRDYHIQELVILSYCIVSNHLQGCTHWIPNLKGVFALQGCSWLYFCPVWGIFKYLTDAVSFTLLIST
jgi:hypothetical protein